MRDKFWHMVLVLGTVTAVFGGALAFVNAHTSEVIEARMFREKVLPTLKTVFGTFKPTNDFLKDRIKQSIGKDAMGRRISADIYVAKKDDQEVALATVVEGRGYGGIFSVLLAADAKNHQIISVKTLQQKETKGFGDRIANQGDPFVKQFSGMRIESKMRLSSEGGAVDAMSGATVTSVAFSKAVKSACDLLLNQMERKATK